MKTATAVVYEERQTGPTAPPVRPASDSAAVLGVSMAEYCGAAPLASCHDSKGYEAVVDGKARRCDWKNKAALCATATSIAASRACVACGVVSSNLRGWRIEGGDVEDRVCEWVEKDVTRRCSAKGVVRASRAAPQKLWVPKS